MGKAGRCRRRTARLSIQLSLFFFFRERGQRRAVAWVCLFFFRVYLCEGGAQVKPSAKKFPAVRHLPSLAPPQFVWRVHFPFFCALGDHRCEEGEEKGDARRCRSCALTQVKAALENKNERVEGPLLMREGEGKEKKERKQRKRIPE